MIKKEFNNYISKIYKDIKIGEIQEKEVRQAFMAGAFTSLNILIDSLDADEKMLERIAMQLYSELSKELKGE